MKRIMIIGLLSLTAATCCMEVPPQKPGQEEIKQSYIKQLPGDVKGIVLPKIVTNLILANIEPNNLIATRHNIKELSENNPWISDLMNRESLMEYIITVIADKMPYNNELEVAKALNDLPGMNNPMVQEWLAKRKNELKSEYKLITMAENNDLDEVKKLLEYVDINSINAQGETALNAAAEHNRIEVVKELLKRKADINKPDKSGWTPLQTAAQQSHLEITRLLIDAGADVNKQDNAGGTALMSAAFDGSSAILKELINAHAHLDTQDTRGMTALLLAVNQKNTNEAQELLKAGANPNISSKIYGSALKQARASKNADIEKLLLQYGARESQSEKSHIEQLPGDLKKIILANITAKNLDEAVKNIKSLARTNKFFRDYINREDVLKFIISTMADTIPDADELTVSQKFQTMQGMQNSAIKEWLAKRKIEIPKEHAFTRALELNNIPEVTRLLQEGVNANSKDKLTKFTALTIAASENYKEIVQKLIASGADINLPSGIPPSYTPLHFAAQENANESLKILLEAGANPNIFSIKSHHSALMKAAAKNNIINVKQLLKAKAQVNVQDIFGYTPLMWAAFLGNTEMLKALLAAHAYIDTPDNDGDTALIWAAYNNHVKVAETLLKAGANPNSKSSKYGSALDLARKNKNVELEELLLQYGTQESQKEQR